MGMKKITLLIGCGGSGIKTLTRLNELMASRNDFRPDMRESIFYFVLDTDEGELDKFKVNIEKQMGSPESSPFIQSAPLTKGYRRLNNLVKSIDDAEKDEKIATMMKKYWWHNEDGEPFRGKHIKDLSAGAAQCCQVSFIATWKYMPKIKQAVNSLLEEIRRRNQTVRDHFANLNVYIVAGLAGGTGRGSWTLVAFKVRQCLLEQGVDVPLDGIFFDGTCYPTLMKRPEKKNNMLVNSATAFSELSAWIHLKNGMARKATEIFSLPSLESPRTAPEAINLNKYFNNDTEIFAPVQTSYVLFGDNGLTASLENNDQYHNMAAAALYAKIVNAEEIDSTESNERFDIASFASTTFEVDTYRLQRYLEVAVQKTFLEKQCDEGEDSKLKKEVAAAVGSAHSPEDDSFLEKYHLWIPEVPNFSSRSNCMDYKKSQKISLLQKMMKSFCDENGKVELLKYKDPIQSTPQELGNSQDGEELVLTTQFRKTLKETQNAEAVKAWVGTAFKLENILDNNTVKVHLNQILKAANLDGANLKGTLHGLVMDQFAPKNKSVSLRRAKLFTDLLREDFSKYIHILDGGVTLDSKVYNNVDNLIASFMEDVNVKSGKSFWEWLLLQKPFNANEIKQLCKKFHYFAHAAVFFRIKKILKEFFMQAVEELNTIQRILEVMSGLLQTASEKLNANLNDVFKNEEYNNIFDILFIDPEKPDAVKNSIPKAGDLQNLYYRPLKPIMSRGILKKLLTDPSNFYAEPGPILKCIKAEFDKLLTLDYEDGWEAATSVASAKIEIPGNISQVIKEHVGLKPDPSGRSFIDKYFSFYKVLEENKIAWIQLLHNTPESQLGGLYDQLRDYLGLEESDYVPHPDNGKKEIIIDEKLIPKMVRSLVVNCNPWIVFSKESTSFGQVPDCLVILPFDSVKYEALIKKEIQDLYGIEDSTWEPTILHPGKYNTKSIPYNRILVYTANTLDFKEDATSIDCAPLEDISSLDYWEDYRELLETAEDLDHKSAAFFKWDQENQQWDEHSRTFAFLAPFFTAPPYKSLRWHPWIKEDVNREKEQLNDVYKALFYVFLGHEESEKEPVSSKDVAKGFTMPLLNMGRKGNHAQSFYFLREPLEWKDGKMDRAIETPWHKDIELENSIDHVVEFLNEQGHADYRSEGGKRLQESISEGARIRRAILKEAEVFFDNIPASLGDSYKEIVRECCHWLNKKMEESKEPKDTKCWEALLQFAKNELKKLG